MKKSKFTNTMSAIFRVIVAIFSFILIIITIISFILYLAVGYKNQNAEIIGLIWAITSINAIMSLLNNFKFKEKSEESKLLEEIKVELQNMNSKMILVKVDEVTEETSNS